MEISAVANHALNSVFRNRKSSFVAVIGVAFALGFVFGALIALDTAYDVIQRHSETTSIAGEGEVARVQSWNDPGIFEDRIVILAISSPSIAVGLIVAVAAVNLSVSMRFDDVRQLRLKGASNGEIFSVLMMEALILSVAAIVVGYVLSLLVYSAVVDSVTVFVLDGGSMVEVETMDVTMSGGTAGLLILSGVGLMSFVSYGPSRRLSRLIPADKVAWPKKKSLPGVGVLVDTMLIALSLASIIDILSGFRWEGSHGFDWYFNSVEGFLVGSGLVLFPAMPFMLAVAISRLLTRPPIMIQKRLGRSMAMADAEHEPRGVEDDPVDRKRATRACILIALVLTFGMFASVTTQSMIEHDKATSRYEVGSDISMSGSYYGYFDLSTWVPSLHFERLSDIKSIQGVSSAVIIEHFVPSLNGDYVAAVAVDPDDYLVTCKPADDYFDDRGPYEILELNEPGAALVTERFAQDHMILMGSQVTLRVSQYGNNFADYWDVNVTVAGTVRDLPAMIFADLLVSYETMSAIPVLNFSMLSTDVSVVIDVDDGHSIHGVASAAGAVLQDAGYTQGYTVTIEDEYSRIDSDPFYNGLAKVMMGEFVYLLLVVFLGIVLVFYVSALQARSLPTQMSAEVDRRARRTGTTIGESFAIVILGIIVGTAVALLTVYLFNMLWVPEEWEPISREVVFMDSTIFMTVASVVLLLITPLVSAALAGRTKHDLRQPR